MIFRTDSSGLNLAFRVYAVDLLLQSLLPVDTSTQFDGRSDTRCSHLMDFLMARLNRIKNRVVIAFDIRAVCVQRMS